MSATASVARQPAPAPTEPLGPARAADLFQISGLLAAAAPDCLPQSPRQVRRRVGEFRVVRRRGRVIGCAALRTLSPGRLELRGVAVAAEARGEGLGRRLVESLAREARSRAATLVCVSRRPGFFERLGFERIPLSEIPDKPGVVQDPDRPRVALAIQAPPLAAARREAP